jgi:hypothetical protein
LLISGGLVALLGIFSFTEYATRST